MSLRDQLNADLKSALKSGDDTRRNTLRLLLAAIQQAEVDKRTAAALSAEKRAGGELTVAQLAELEQLAFSEEEVVAVIQKEAKARREAIADARRADRADLIAANEVELSLIESYLPQPLAREAIVALAQAAIGEAGAVDVRQLGAVMKLLTPRTRGLADGKLVSDIVRELLGK